MTRPVRASLGLVVAVGVGCGPAADRPAQELGGVISVVVEDHPVSETPPTHPHVEPFLAVDPLDDDRLLAGTIVVSSDRTTWTCATLLSEDGGAMWSRQSFDIERCIDPWVVFTGDGGSLFAATSIRRDGEGDDRFALEVFASSDGGRSWSGPTVAGRTFEHAMMVVGSARGPSTPTYLVGRVTRSDAEGEAAHEIFLGRHRAGGGGFDTLQIFRPTPLSHTPTGLVVLPDGSLALSFRDEGEAAPAGGASDTPSLGSIPRTWLVHGDPVSDFSDPRPISDRCGNAPTFPGWPFLAADTTAGPRGGRLYHICTRTGFRGIDFRWSADLGSTWHSPSRRPDPRPDQGAPHVRTVMLAVSRDGAVGIAWQDRRNDPERECQELYFSASIDGGATFLDPERISTAASCPLVPGNGSVGESWAGGGDYSSLTSAPDGTFHILWADSRRGLFEIRHAAVRVR
ncbi:MAG: glycoside hydrolase [Gemmatimonadota bacterium]|nr:glycoside hydrolase [Gemmatimonadota bacterium]